MPINKVDSLIAKLIWNGTGDSLQLVRLVDQLGATKSSEAYCILFSACCRPIMVHDLNMFNSLAATLSYYGGYRVLNHYFLHDEVSSKLSFSDFESAVFMACRKKEPRCYYIKPEDPFKKQIREWSALNTAQYDLQIISVINKYSNLSKFGGIVHYPEALDSIVKNVLELPFVGDAMHDKCAIKAAIYPGVSVLGVIIMIDERPVEKCYKIQIGHSTSNYQNEKTKRNTSGDYLIYVSNYFEPNFIYHQVELCNPD